MCSEKNHDKAASFAREDEGYLFSESVVEISANIDDMAGEDLGAAMELLLDGGALDVWFEPIQMKKNRPAVKLSLLVCEEDAERFAELTLRHTTTLGVRMQIMRRFVLERQIETVNTAFGDVRVKKGLLGGEVIKEMAEYEDVRRIASEQGLPHSTVRKTIATEMRKFGSKRSGER